MTIGRQRLERMLGRSAGARRRRPAADPRSERMRSDLERLFGPPGAAGRGPVPRPTPIDEVVTGQRVETPAGGLFVARNRFELDQAGPSIRLAPDRRIEPGPARLLADRPVPSALAVDRLLFLDTETTGLAGGTGTLAFMVGAGWFDGGAFVVEQAFLEGPQDEAALLHVVDGWTRASEGDVTFNGRTFDLPLLETRFRMARRSSPFEGRPSVDLLPAARRLWRDCFADCRLTTLEERVLGSVREGDVPGSLIPGLYFRYLQNRDARPLGPIFYHNARDLVAMAGLLEVALTGLVDRVWRGPYNPYRLGRYFESIADDARAADCYQAALEVGAPADGVARAAGRLALHHKRSGQPGRAVPLWLDLLEDEAFAVDAAVELAKHCEHGVGDPRAALAFVDRVVDRAAADAREALLHRRARLVRKIAAARPRDEGTT